MLYVYALITYILFGIMNRYQLISLSFVQLVLTALDLLITSQYWLMDELIDNWSIDLSLICLSFVQLVLTILDLLITSQYDFIWFDFNLIENVWNLQQFYFFVVCTTGTYGLGLVDYKSVLIDWLIDNWLIDLSLIFCRLYNWYLRPWTCWLQVNIILFYFILFHLILILIKFWFALIWLIMFGISNSFIFCRLYNWYLRPWTCGLQVKIDWLIDNWLIDWLIIDWLI
jgi:hypothetical protein